MTRFLGLRWSALAVALLIVSFVSIGIDPALALQVRPATGRFDALTVTDPTAQIDVATTPLTTLSAAGSVRGPWEAFRAAHGAAW